MADNSLSKTPEEVAKLYKQSVAFHSALQSLKELRTLLIDESESNDFYLRRIDSIMLSLPFMKEEESHSHDYRYAMLRLNDVSSVLSRYAVAELSEQEHEQLLDTLDKAADSIIEIVSYIATQFQNIVRSLICLN